MNYDVSWLDRYDLRNNPRRWLLLGFKIVNAPILKFVHDEVLYFI